MTWPRSIPRPRRSVRVSRDIDQVELRSREEAMSHAALPGGNGGRIVGVVGHRDSTHRQRDSGLKGRKGAKDAKVLFTDTSVATHRR